MCLEKVKAKAFLCSTDFKTHFDIFLELFRIIMFLLCFVGCFFTVCKAR